MERIIGSWNYRKEKVIEYVNSIQPTIIGTQEGVQSVLEIFHKGIGQLKYGSFGVARDAKSFFSTKPNEHNQIFYDTSKLEFITGDTFWLAEDISKPPKTPGFCGKHNRIVTWAKFQLISSKQILFVFNTHLDNKDIEDLLCETRAKAMDLLIAQMKIITQQEDDASAAATSIIVMGDFNSKRDAYPYQTLIEKNGFSDAWITAETREGDVAYSFHDWLGVKNPLENEDGLEPGSKQIDFITYYPKSIQVQKTAVVTEKWESHGEDRYLSDHFPILSYLSI
ncbi:hypothetical protein CTEN210_06843 [Chaetoceros tenuissimus]|uniref:Endonuclease/exonuclease/phosphatase domain-containing protein n=1 Tax=Chaetoceros tenuissimus TaxID=426638 RepID=A0AAD3CQM0_9STRA|nr:hypothetical protein CTEN210_06843 [Chaetoceros tenuissimus]